MDNNSLTFATREEFITELKKHSKLWKYFAENIDQEMALSGYNDTDNEFAIYSGDIIGDISVNMKAFNMLFIGDIKATLVDSDTDDLGWDEGGTLFVTGNVECDFFNGHYGKTTIIGKNLIVNKVLNCGFSNSASYVLGDLQARFNFIGDTSFTTLGNSSIENQYYSGDDASELRKFVGLSINKTDIDEIELQERFRELVSE